MEFKETLLALGVCAGIAGGAYAMFGSPTQPKPSNQPVVSSGLENIAQPSIINSNVNSYNTTTTIHNHGYRPSTSAPVVVARPGVVYRPVRTYHPATCHPQTCTPRYIHAHPHPIARFFRWVGTGHWFRWDDPRNRHNW